MWVLDAVGVLAVSVCGRNAEIELWERCIEGVSCPTATWPTVSYSEDCFPSATKWMDTKPVWPYHVQSATNTDLAHENEISHVVCICTEVFTVQSANKHISFGPVPNSEATDCEESSLQCQATLTIVGGLGSLVNPCWDRKWMDYNIAGAHVCARNYSGSYNGFKAWLQDCLIHRN